MVAFTTFATAFAAASALVAAAPVEKRSYTGQATWFEQGGNPGACGNYNSDDSKVVALDSRMYSGDKCGKTVKITNDKTGASVTAIVADLCPTCASAGSLDLSVGAFKAIGNMDDGVLPITWDFVASQSKRETYSGTATWYTQNGNPGACGKYNPDSAYIIALDSRMYEGGSHCGQKVQITNDKTGKSIEAVVADECPSCVSSGSIDLSTAAFSALANMDDGIFPVSWYFSG